MLSPPITLIVPNPRAQHNNACVSFESIGKVIGELAQVNDDHTSHFCSSYANLGDWKETGLKKAVLPARFLSNYRRTLLGVKERKPGKEDDEHEWWFVVLCGGRFPLTTYRLVEQGKARRYIDRKVSTKSVL